MQQPKGFFRETRAHIALVVGVLCFCIGLLSWENMGKERRIAGIVITSVALILSLVWWWVGRSKWRKRRRLRAPGYEPAARNPPATLPPRREQ
jgi:hypothetical protein